MLLSDINGVTFLFLKIVSSITSSKTLLNNLITLGLF
ncbi:hypothetical protein GIG_03692 [Mycoplasmopsis anatis 1340]|uniref:Uncharacterized protein n=1 Tax=Mycoplasmopsis anatis 1340 TaxID=1034808 RepID=F9QEC5_9BACT|nr:hypothetical protein GIG_03692 [Mycoplasmopsis anatis 1340]